MSTAKNKADTGPDNEINEDSDLENGQEQDVSENEPTNLPESVIKDEEETSNPVLLSSEIPDDARPYQLYQPVHQSPDGSLSIPDDTPSLQVSRSRS